MSDDGDRDLLTMLLVGGMGALVVGSLGVLTVGAVAGLLASGRIPAVGLSEASGVLTELPSHLDDPRLAWPETTRDGLPGPAGFAAAAAVVVVLAGAVTFAAVRLWGWWREGRSPDPVARSRSRLPVRIPLTRDPHGPKDRGYATSADVADLAVRGSEAGRVVLGWSYGRLVASEPEHSVLVVGATRSGKTTRFAIPALLDWDGPALVLSAKTDLLHATRAARAERGTVWVYDPTGVSGAEPAGWSPLQGSTDWRGALRTAAAMSRLSGTTAGLGGSGHWEKVAAQLLAPMLLAASVGGLDMGDVVRWTVTKQMEQPRKLLYALGPDAEAAMRGLQAYLSLEPRAQDNAFSTVRTALDAYEDPDVVERSRRWDVSPKRLLDGGRHTLYVVATASDQQRLAPVFLALVDEVLRAAYRRAAASRAASGDPVADRPRLLVLLDEAANVAPLPDLATIASTAGGEGVQLLTVYQDLAQVRHRYRDEWGSIASNHVCKVVLPGVTDPDTLRYFADVIGDTDVPAESVNRAHDGKRSVTTHEQRRPVAAERDLRELPAGQGLVLYGSRPPIRIGLVDPPEATPAVSALSPVSARDAAVPAPETLIVTE